MNDIFKVNIIEACGVKEQVWGSSFSVDYKIKLSEGSVFKIVFTFKPLFCGPRIQREQYALNKEGLVVFSCLEELESIVQNKASVDFTCDTYNAGPQGVLKWQELFSSEEMGVMQNGEYSYKANLAVYDKTNNLLSSYDFDITIQYKHKLFGSDEIQVI